VSGGTTSQTATQYVKKTERRFMGRIIRCALGALALLAAHGPASAQGTVPIAGVQQVDINGKPLAGCQVYVYRAGTVATPQQPYYDYGLSQVAPNPLTCDQYGRVPFFWVANGLIHVRLLDSTGVVVWDNTQYALGPSSGSGGGGGTVDPTTIAATGDIKFRATGEVLTGWVRMNGLTIGSATSGASERANSDTQNLFIYEWTNCSSPTSNARCAVSGGLGASALADFNANKTLTLPDWRDRGPVGRDCMGNSCRAGLLSSNIGSGGGDGVDTGGAFGGAPNTTITQTYLPNYPLTITITDPGHSHSTTAGGGSVGSNGGPLSAPNFASNSTGTAFTGISASANLGGGGTIFPNISAFELGTWYVKL
jgi:hypothetical protein